MKSYLEFEKDIKGLEEELEKLKDPYYKEGLSQVDTEKISSIQSQIDDKLKISYENLNAWQKTQVARHEERPKAKFFIESLFSNFINLRLFDAKTNLLINNSGDIQSSEWSDHPFGCFAL